MERPDASQDNQQQALAIFYHAAEELCFFKRQPLQVTNYALLAYIALASAPLWVIHSWRGLLYVACVVLIWVVAGLSIWMQCNLHSALKKERGRMDDVREHHLTVMRTMHQSRPQVRSVTFVLCLPLLLGAALATFVMLSRPEMTRMLACITAG